MSLTPGAVQQQHLKAGTWQRNNGTVTVPTPPPGVKLWVGATVTDAAGSNAFTNFQAANTKIGPLRSRRTFVPPKTVATFPTNISQTDAGTDVANGIYPFLSAKADVASIIAGQFDGVIQQLVASMPRTTPAWFTMWHEPEGNNSDGTPFMTAAQFVQLHQHIYPLCKAVNANVLVGPVHMTYQWGSQAGAKVVAGLEDDWWVGASFCDFIGTDSYWNTWEGAPQPLSTDPSHQHWHNWAKTKGKPLYIVERGVLPNGSAAASILLQDEQWLLNNGYAMFMYWDAMGTGSVDWRIDTDPTMSSAWQQIAGRGRAS